jgi:hypothetical protein
MLKNIQEKHNILDKSVLEKKTIKDRRDYLSNFLKTNKIRQLSKEEKEVYLSLYTKYYFPNMTIHGDKKIEEKEIVDVSIRKDKYGNNCFCISTNEIKNIPTSIQKLAGTKIKSDEIEEKQKLIRALRNSIDNQIFEFRKNNKIKKDAICDMTNEKMGYDVEVDHIKPFQIIAEEWLKRYENKDEKPKYKYDNNECNYILLSPYYEEWNDYHKKNCELRYLSKKGNRIKGNKIL